MKRIHATLALAFALCLAAPAHGQAVAQFRLLSAATTNSTSVTGGKATVMMIVVTNHNAASRFLKFSDNAAAPTCGTTAVTKTIEIPGVTTSPTAFVIVIPYPSGLVFSKGIGFCVTGAIADADTTAIGANDVVVNIDYR